MTIEIEERSLAETFINHRPQLRRAALAIVGAPELADDVVQDAYVKLIAADTAATVRYPLGYCFQVVRNMALDHRRRTSLEADLMVQEEEGHHVPTPHDQPERRAINRQNIAMLDAVLGTLPARTRHVFELYHLGGRTQRDIGAELGVSLGLVNGMIRDATMALTRCRGLLLGE